MSAHRAEPQRPAARTSDLGVGGASWPLPGLCPAPALPFRPCLPPRLSLPPTWHPLTPEFPGPQRESVLEESFPKLVSLTHRLEPHLLQGTLFSDHRESP